MHPHGFSLEQFRLMFDYLYADAWIADFHPLFKSDLILGYWLVRSEFLLLITSLLKEVGGGFCVI